MLIHEEESLKVVENLPLIQILLESNKLTTSEKLRILENTNIDIRCYLKSIGEI